MVSERGLIQHCHLRTVVVKFARRLSWFALSAWNNVKCNRSIRDSEGITSVQRAAEFIGLHCICNGFWHIVGHLYLANADRCLRFCVQQIALRGGVFTFHST